MNKISKIQKKVLRGVIGGIFGTLIISFLGPLWHSLLGHSDGFGFFSFNFFGWVFIILTAILTGIVKGTIVGVVGLAQKLWLTLICSLIIWATLPFLQAINSIQLTNHALYLNGGYAILSILAAILCAVIVHWKPREREILH